MVKSRVTFAFAGVLLLVGCSGSPTAEPTPVLLTSDEQPAEGTTSPPAATATTADAEPTETAPPAPDLAQRWGGTYALEWGEARAVAQVGDVPVRVEITEEPWGEGEVIKWMSFVEEDGWGATQILDEVEIDCTQGVCNLFGATVNGGYRFAADGTAFWYPTYPTVTEYVDGNYTSHQSEDVCAAELMPPAEVPIVVEAEDASGVVQSFKALSYPLHISDVGELCQNATLLEIPVTATRIG